MGAPRLLLDSPSLYFRAFFALPRSIRSPSGQPVNAVRGYLDMLTRLLTDHHPRTVVHCFDADWRPAWRVAAWPGYKLQRVDIADPEGMPGQPELITQFLTAAGQPVAFASGFEADDVIATLSEEATPAQPDWIVSGDRDLLQLVRDDGVQLLFTVRGVSELARFDEAAVEAKYGVRPQQYADFAILRGDPSDGLPGLKGVGERGAQDLVRRHGSVRALLDAPPPRHAAVVNAQRAYLEAMLRIVPVIRDVRCDIAEARAPDVDALRALASAQGLEAAVERLLGALHV